MCFNIVILLEWILQNIDQYLIWNNGLVSNPIIFDKSLKDRQDNTLNSFRPFKDAMSEC